MSMHPSGVRAHASVTVFVAVLAMLLVAVPGTATTQPPGSLVAGSGRAEITPPVGSPQWGYGDRSCVLNPADCIEQRTRRPGDTELRTKAFRASEGVHQRLHARAFLLRDGEGDEVALVQADIGASSAALHAAVVDRLAVEGITADELLIAPTHTHAGPGGLHGDPFHFVAFGDAVDPRIIGIVADGIALSVRRAAAAMAPATAAVGRTEIMGATRNRSMPAHLLNDDLDPAADEVNRTVTMLRVDRADGAPLGLFSTFANHGTVQGSDQLLFSGDNAGYAARLLEAGMAAAAAAAGAPEGPAPIAGWANGEEGDVSPVAEGDGPFGPSFDNGRRQAVPALALWASLGEQLRGDLDIGTTLDVRAMSDGADAGWDMSRTPLYGLGGSCLPADLPGVGAKCPMAPAGPPPTHLPFHTIRIGDTAWLGLPFEVTTQAGRRIREAAGEALAADPTIAHVAVAGLANDYGGYLTTPEEYTAQRYEGQMTWWGPEQQRFVAEAAARSARLLIAGEQGAERPAGAVPTLPDASPAGDALAEARSPAGQVLAQPTAESPSMSWTGGHPGVDLPRESVQVTVQRRLPDGGWVDAVFDGDGDVLITFIDTADAEVWTATWSPTGDLTPTSAGEHRFVITGRTATLTDGEQPYRIESAAFTVG